MPRSLVAISGSAIAAIYMAGYLHTQSADETIAAAALPTLAVAQGTPAGSTAVPTAAPPAVVQRQAPATARGVPAALPTSTPAVASAAQTQAQYQDGTYTGTGTSRRGDVWVSVQIQGGRIANVTISRSTLQYPVTDIQGLPAQVVQRQSAQVDIVSRATYSSTAFRTAVTQALSAAQGA
jgi:uncharacterized protein with FMN-binding domain